MTDRDLKMDKPSKKKLSRYKNPHNYRFNCQCGKNFSHEHSYNSHKRKMHGEPSSLQRKEKYCPLCTFSTIALPEMIQHFEEDHEEPLDREAYFFESKEEFTNWKKEMESVTKSKYIQESGCKKFKSYTTFAYRCYRSGNYVPTGNGKRRLKSQGSDKMNAYCPACIKVRIEPNGKCYTDFISTHIGHELINTEMEAPNKRSKIDISLDPEFLKRKDTLIVSFMEAMEGIVLPEQLDYMESLPVHSTLTAIKAIRDKKNKRRRKTKKAKQEITHELNISDHDYDDCVKIVCKIET